MSRIKKDHLPNAQINKTNQDLRSHPNSDDDDDDEVPN